MTDINTIVEENSVERFYVFRGHAGATAIELVYDGHRAVFDAGTKARSLVAAKAALRAYKALDGFWPSERWATMTPVVAETRDAELRALAEIDRAVRRWMVCDRTLDGLRPQTIQRPTRARFASASMQ